MMSLGERLGAYLYTINTETVCYFKQKTAYEMRISDRSSDVCSSDLPGIMEDRCGRCRSAKRSIIPNIGPDPARIGLGLGQNWHRRIVAMQSLGGKDVGFDQ